MYMAQLSGPAGARFMSHLQPVSYLFLAVASFLAGAINAIAGGGTLLTFPTLLASGISPVIANATNTVAMVPGAIAGAYSFRADLPALGKLLKIFAAPAIIGGFVGAKLMLLGGDKVLAMLVPWLILAGSLLFLLQEPLAKRAVARAQQQASPAGAEAAARAEGKPAEFRNVPMVVLLVFLVAIYGGYFGAGMGILTLAALGYMGMTDIHQMNGVKNILTASVNLVASIAFILEGRVDGLIAVLMAAGAILGALSSGGIALKIGQRRVRQLIIFIGLGITVWMFYKQATGGL